MYRWLDARQTVGRVAIWLILISMLSGTLALPAPLDAAPFTQGVQRIRFASGATSAVVSGNLSGGQTRRYVLTALAGQTMTIQPYSDGAPVIVSVFAPSRDVLGSAASGESWSGRLPATGDYGIAVYPAPATGNINFQLRVEVVNNAAPPPAAPERIRFASGATSAQVTGYLPSASSKSYVLGASAGQVMTVNGWTNNGPFRFTIADPNGATLGSGNQGEWWSGTLPRTGDYRITLQSPNDAPPANYGLQVSIVNAAPAPTPTPIPPAPAQRIYFPRGATSVTLTGYVDSYGPVRYVLGARRGQTMTIALSTLYGNNTSVAVYDARGYFLGATNGGGTWNGYLPSTGDYTVEVQAPRENPGDHFSLWLEIR